MPGKSVMLSPFIPDTGCWCLLFVFHSDQSLQRHISFITHFKKSVLGFVSFILSVLFLFWLLLISSGLICCFILNPWKWIFLFTFCLLDVLGLLAVSLVSPPRLSVSQCRFSLPLWVTSCHNLLVHKFSYKLCLICYKHWVLSFILKSFCFF